MNATHHTTLLRPSMALRARREDGQWVWRRSMNAGALALSDTVALGTAALIVNQLDVLLTGHTQDVGWMGFAWFAWLIGAALFQLLPDWGLSEPTWLERSTKLMIYVFGLTSCFLLLTGQASLHGAAVVLLSLLLALPAVTLARLSVKAALIRGRRWGVPAAIYGGAVTGSTMVQVLRDHPSYGYNPIAIFDDNQELHGESIHDVAVVGSTQLRISVPVAILAMPGLQREQLVALLDGPLAPYSKVIIIPDLFEIGSMWVRPRDFQGVMGLEVARNLLNGSAQVFKRIMDVFSVLISAVFWVPLCALVALLIWLEDGENPLFFQKRVGLRGELFTAWKFRTMVPDAENVLRRRLEEDADLRAEWEANYKLRHDPRITRIGRLLRRTSLDELPQLVNVLLGDMSLVGPRPLPEYHQQQLSTQAQQLRIMVQPGMTGLWQVSGRSELGNQGMERWDPYYVRNWSIWLDLFILVRTVKVVLKGSGAY